MIILLVASTLILTGTGRARQHPVIDTTSPSTIQSSRVIGGTGGGAGQAGILDGTMPVEPVSLSIVFIDRGVISQPERWTFFAEVHNTSTRTVLIPTRTDEDQAIDACGSEVVQGASLQFDTVAATQAMELRSSARLFGCAGWKDSLISLFPGEIITIKGTISSPSIVAVTALRASWDMSELRYTPTAEGFRLDSVGKMFIQSGTMKLK